MKILVTGGAGYIGSHTVAELLRLGHKVVVFDNLVYGHKEAVRCPLVIGDLLHKNEINSVFEKEKFDGVIHFAAYAASGESMQEPAKYFENNLQGGLNLLEAMRKHDIDKIVFSSTAAVYGFSGKLPLVEDGEKKPVSVYGQSKLMFETILEWYNQLFGINSIRLRYFNAAGASLDGSIGEDHKPETHLIPIIIQTALGLREKLIIFGNDYKTKDGTNVRDYVHVLDLANAHIKALKYLFSNKVSEVFNMGTGRGYSNLEVVEMVKKITKIDFPVEIGPRRLGDADALYANNSKIKRVLGWEPKYSELEIIIKTAWKWHKNHPYGFGV